MTEQAYGGLDLSASPRRRSAVALLEAEEIRTLSVRTDEEIVNALASSKLVAVDSPLTLPKGLGHRKVDRLLLRMGFRVLPASWPSMRALHERALRIASALQGLGVNIIETHPTSALMSSGCGDVAELVARLGLHLRSRPRTKDESDAVIAAIVALAYERGLSYIISAGDGRVAILTTFCR
ncbi:MAG: DUF429 domain-containing protein [Acidilobus sp.]